MKRIYLLLTVVGFILPSYFVAIESIETGNVLLYADPLATMEGMFANRISSIFAIDLLFAVAVFMLWSYQESKRYGIKKVGLVWALTFLFGFASGLPLFLYLREEKRTAEA